jgi:ElaB/YqjD/DUF883 family membrane-anchored ribosome-binding protein
MLDENRGEDTALVVPGELALPSRQDSAGTTTVITVGITPPIIAGGLAIAYLGVRRLSGIALGGQRGARGGGAAAAAVGGVATKATESAGQLVGTAGGAAREAGDAAGRAVQTLGQGVGRLTQTVQTGASGVAGTAAGRARAVPEILRENPALALGLGVGIGALIGLAVPPTRRERELIGPASESMLGQVRTGAQETLEKVQLVAEEAGSTIRESATEVGLVPTMSGPTNGQG